MLYNAKNPHGGDVYEGDIGLDFSANTNPFGAPERVKEAVSSCAEEISRYPDPYCRELVSAIAEFEKTPERFVLCGAGAAELIYSYCGALRPKKAMELAPTFSEYSLALEGTGCEMIRCFLKEEDGFAVTEALLGALIKEKPDVLFLCDPNNPTGRLIEPGLKKLIVEVCAENGIRILADECFMDLARGGLSLVPELENYRGIAVLKAFTKSFGMAGLRLGYCLSADSALLEGMSRKVQPWNVSSAAQRAGTAALSDTGFIEKTRELIEKERPYLAGALRDLGLSVWDSDANFMLFRAEPSLGERLRAKGILIRDCSNYYGLGRGFFRIAVKLPEENAQLIEALKECL
jgi:threonine-phosphate decarboxylase